MTGSLLHWTVVDCGKYQVALTVFALLGICLGLASLVGGFRFEAESRGATNRRGWLAPPF